MGKQVTTKVVTLNIVAHQDDDLLFLSPNLMHAIQAGGNVRTVYVTAGDAGLDGSYWHDRENGVQAAYAEMAGVANLWTQRDAGVPDHSISVFTLADRRNVSLAFMRLPDGKSDGSGFASTGHQSLQGLWTGSIPAIDAIDGSSRYALSTLTTTLGELISSFRPDQINTLDYRHRYGDGDHSDHHIVAYLTQSAVARLNLSVPLSGYEGYPVIPLPANVSDADQTAKWHAFITYAQYDKFARDVLAESDSTPYHLWVARQYRVNQSRPLIAHYHGLKWREVHRPRPLKSRIRNWGQRLPNRR